MILPAPLPDEMLCSLITRIARFNGLADMRTAVEALMGGRLFASLVDASICFPSFCKATKGAYGTPHELVRDLTAFNAQVALGDISSLHVAEIIDGRRLPTLGDVTFSGRTALRFCRLCMERDLATYGQSYWHRVHQLAFVLVCPMHDEPLCFAPMKRSRLHRQFEMPGDAMARDEVETVLIRSNRAAWIAIAKMACELMHDRDELPACLADAVIADLDYRGFGRNRKTAVDDRQADSAMRFIVDILPDLLAANIDARRQASILKRCLADYRKYPSFAYVAMASWLYGDWLGVKQRCAWYAVLELPHIASGNVGVCRPNVSPSRLAADSVLQQYRRKCLQYIASTPTASRAEFQRVFQVAFSWLRRNDQHWLESQLPLVGQGRAQLQLFD